MAVTATGPRRGFVDSPDGSIEYCEWGSGDPLILLHFTPGSCMSFEDVASLLADDFRLIAMSTMGYGRSARPSPPYTSVHQFAQAVSWLMDGLGLAKASVFGVLTGSEIAVEVAAGWPERVEKLVLQEVFNWKTDARRAVHERIHRYIPARSDGSHLVELWKKYGGDRPGRDLEEASRRFLDYLAVNGPEPAYGEMGWEGAGPYAMTRYEMWENTPRIQAPTLVIHGTTSELGRSHAKFLTTIPNARGARIPSDGNLGLGESSELWASELRTFLTASNG